MSDGHPVYGMGTCRRCGMEVRTTPAAWAEHECQLAAPLTQHSLRPWKVSEGVYEDQSGERESWANIEDQSGDAICHLAVDRDQLDADARLIAAAPELLEAIETCVTALERCAYGTCGDDLKLFPAALEAARKSIAKARCGS